MFRRFAAAAACAALFVLLGAVPTGSLYVTTLPTGVDVWVDGTYVGHSPLVLDALAAGRHTISLTKTGWLAQDLDVSIIPAVASLSSVQMSRAPSRTMRFNMGLVAVHGTVPRELLIDGQPVKPDKNGFYPASAGLHEIAVRTAAGKISRNITVYPDMRTDIVVRDDETTRSAVVAPASDYLSADEIKIEGARVVLRHARHDVVAKIGSTSYRVDGASVAFDAAPTLIGGKLYLPIDLLSQLTAGDKPK